MQIEKICKFSASLLQDKPREQFCFSGVLPNHFTTNTTEFWPNEIFVHVLRETPYGSVIYFIENEKKKFSLDRWLTQNAWRCWEVYFHLQIKARPKHLFWKFREQGRWKLHARIINGFCGFLGLCNEEFQFEKKMLKNILQ